MKDEIWKDIEGYEGLYQVSNLGRIKTVERVYRNRPQPSVIRKTRIDPNGYPKVRLSKGGKYRDLFIHRLVAIAFIPNPENKATVNHIDGDKSNFNMDNLEWATTQENTKHARENGLVKDILTEEDCEYIRKNFKPRDPEFSGVALGRKFGVHKSHICKIAKGQIRNPK